MNIQCTATYISVCLSQNHTSQDFRKYHTTMSHMDTHIWMHLRCFL